MWSKNWSFSDPLPLSQNMFETFQKMYWLSCKPDTPLPPHMWHTSWTVGFPDLPLFRERYVPLSTFFSFFLLLLKLLAANLSYILYSAVTFCQIKIVNKLTELLHFLKTGNSNKGPQWNKIIIHATRNNFLFIFNYAECKHLHFLVTGVTRYYTRTTRENISEKL